MCYRNSPLIRNIYLPCRIKNPEASAIINATNKFKFQHCFRPSPEKKAIQSEKCNMGRLRDRARTGRWRYARGACFHIPARGQPRDRRDQLLFTYLTSTTTWSRFANHRSSSRQVDMCSISAIIVPIQLCALETGLNRTLKSPVFITGHEKYQVLLRGHILHGLLSHSNFCWIATDKYIRNVNNYDWIYLRRTQKCPKSLKPCNFFRI